MTAVRELTHDASGRVVADGTKVWNPHRSPIAPKALRMIAIGNRMVAARSPVITCDPSVASPNPATSRVGLVAEPV
ncbi:MAG TPA: hypothetical protein VK507_25615 [Iamia sp.]|nr:hypothetical protein [Iamia sp.]